ncbi:MAG: PPC domain-containing protein, partial [Myxococcales bacterium]|nr:PPC domain-containing protein [Myxococcales bacterium]
GADGVTVVARFNVALPPLQLALRRADAPAADPVDVSVATPGEAWVSAGPGEYLLEVRAPVGGSGAYRLLVDAGPACADDPYDRPWRNDVEANARAVGDGIIHGTLCPRDEDWFRVPGPGRIEVSIQGALATVNGQPAPATVDAPARIRVTGEGDYTLTVRTRLDGAAACAAATPLALDQPTAAQIAAGPEAFAPACRGAGSPDRVFQVQVPRAGRLAVSLLDPDPTAGLMLYGDCAAVPLACTPLAGDRLEHAVEAGTYFVVVDGPYAGRIQASLSADGPPAVCAAPEPLVAGQPAQAPVDGAGAALGGVCLDPAAPVGAFGFVLDEPSQVELRLTGGGPMSAVSLRAVCADPATEFQCEAGFEPLVVARLLPGAYVALAQGGGQLNLTATPDAAPVAFEDMCFPGGARPTFAAGDQRQVAGDTSGAADGFNAAACGAAVGGADQVLQFDVVAPVRLRATARSDAFAPVLSLTADDCFGAPVCGAGPGLDTVLQPGDYGLVVDADGAGRGAYVVDLAFEAP